MYSFIFSSIANVEFAVFSAAVQPLYIEPSTCNLIESVNPQEGEWRKASELQSRARNPLIIQTGAQVTHL